MDVILPGWEGIMQTQMPPGGHPSSPGFSNSPVKICKHLWSGFNESMGSSVHVRKLDKFLQERQENWWVPAAKSSQTWHLWAKLSQQSTSENVAGLRGQQ